MWPLNFMKMTWCSACSLLLFLFRTNGKKRYLDGNGFRDRNSNFFRKCHPESYLITTMFIVPPQQIRGTMTTAFWKIPYSSLFYGHGLTCVLDLSSRLKCHWNENQWRCLGKDVCAKCVLGRILHQNRNHVSLILCFFFSDKPNF